MGCVCSKESSKTTTGNPLCGNVVDYNPELFIASKKQYLATGQHPMLCNSRCKYSLLYCPTAEILLKRQWMRKRGHMVRNWKRRYCVIETNELKYYGKDLSVPPYGKQLKGKIGYQGAVCMLHPESSESLITFQIFGNIGEKDLLFQLDATPDAEEWLQMLVWSIRRATISVLVQNMKQSSQKDPDVSGTDITAQQKVQERRNCSDWIQNEKFKFFHAIENLSFARIYRVLYYRNNGAISIIPCLLGLWSAFGPSYVPTDDIDDANHIGLKWEFIDPDMLNSSDSDGISAGLKFTEAGAKVLSFADIVDMVVTEHDGRKMGGNHEHPIANKTCAAHKGNIISICSKFGYSLEIMACCLSDYEGSVLSIRDVWLHIAMNKKLTKAGSGRKYTSSKNQTSPSALLAAEVTKGP